MDTPYWHRQSADKPLFEDLLWSRPENRMTAGKLLIIGGNLHGFAAPAEAYAAAAKAGIGSAQVLLPDAVKKLVGPVMENGEFSPSTPSGSFSQKALIDFMEHAHWADETLLAGELGRNSETAILLEAFLQKSPARLTVTRDAADYFITTPLTVLERTDTLLVISLAQMQKLAMNARFPRPVTFSMGAVQLADILHEFTEVYPVHIIVKHLDTFFVASGGQVSTTKSPENPEVWRVKTAATAAVWRLQNPSKPFESLTTAVTTY